LCVVEGLGWVMQMFFLVVKATVSSPARLEETMLSSPSPFIFYLISAYDNLLLVLVVLLF